MRPRADIDYVETYEQTVPSPTRKKQAARILKDELDGAVMSSGVFEISAAKILNPVEKRKEAVVVEIGIRNLFCESGLNPGKHLARFRSGKFRAD